MSERYKSHSNPDNEASTLWREAIILRLEDLKKSHDSQISETKRLADVQAEMSTRQQKLHERLQPIEWVAGKAAWILGIGVVAFIAGVGSALSTAVGIPNFFGKHP